MTQPLPIRSVLVAGKRTSMRLDDESWNALLAICCARKTTLPVLLTSIDRGRGALGRTAAVRAYIVQSLKSAPDLPPAAGPDIVADLVARNASFVLASSSVDDFHGAERKLQFSLDSVSQIEEGGLQKAWKVWKSLRAERGFLPGPDEFLRCLSGQDVVSNLLDVSPEDPFKFRILQLNALTLRFAGADYTGRLVGEYPFAIHARGMQSDFNQAKRELLPTYQILHQRFQGIERAYTRLVFPLATDGEHVDRLVTIVRTVIAARSCAA